MAGRVSDIQRMTEEGVDVIFNKNAKTPQKKYYPQIVWEKKIDKAVGIYDTIGDIGPAEVKVEGNAYNFDNFEQGYQTTISVDTVGKGVEVSMEVLEDDLYGVVKSRFGPGLFRVLLSRKERACADLYNDAFSDTGADGVALISASHPLVKNPSSLNDNLATGALTPDNFIKAKMKFNSIYDQAGDFFDTDPTHLLIHKNKLYTALAILQSQLMAFELSNTKNVVNDEMPVKIVVNNYLDYTAATGVSPWFLLDRTLQDAGAVLQVKKGLTLKTWWENNNEVFRGTLHERDGTGVISPGYCIVGSTGA